MFGQSDAIRHAPADLEHVVQGFQPGGVLFPIVMAKVIVRGAGGNDEVSLDQRGSIGN